MILVTGGTGLVGSHLLFQLASDTVPVKAIYRTERKLEHVRHVFSYYTKDPDKLFDRIIWVKADLNDLYALQNAFQDISLVYHCAALISFDPNDFRKLVKANEEGTANLVNLCITSKVRKLCYVSSIAAIGRNLNQELVTELNEWWNTNVNPYALTKHLAEMEVWRGTMEGVPAVIVSPGVILGPGFWDSGSGRLFKIAAKGGRYYPPGGTGFVAIFDVITMMISLMKSDVENERFIAVGENLTYKQILCDLAVQLGKSSPRRMISIRMLQILWRLDWFWHLISGQKRKLSRVQVNSLRNRLIYDNGKIKKQIEFEYQSLSDQLPFYCDIFREENPSFFS